MFKKNHVLLLCVVVIIIAVVVVVVVYLTSFAQTVLYISFENKKNKISNPFCWLKRTI
jgi:flagellar biosynthesis/type III secretory pathway M-ring protein FliF/YscJ